MYMWEAFANMCERTAQLYLSTVNNPSSFNLHFLKLQTAGQNSLTTSPNTIVVIQPDNCLHCFWEFNCRSLNNKLVLRWALIELKVQIANLTSSVLARFEQPRPKSNSEASYVSSGWGFNYTCSSLVYVYAITVSNSEFLY